METALRMSARAAQASRGLFTHLSGVDFPLDDIEDGDVAALLGAGRDHDIFRLGQASHHV